MALHRLNQVTIGVPNPAETADFYRDFNLTETADGTFATADGGEQLRLVHSPVRRLLALTVGADDPDDIARVTSQLTALDVAAPATLESVSAVDPGTGVNVTVAVTPRVTQPKTPAPVYNGPGRLDREGRSPRLPAGPDTPQSTPAQARPCRRRLDRSGRKQPLLPARHRLQDQRRGQGCRVLHALLQRPPQPTRAEGARAVPPPHIVAGRGRRRDWARRPGAAAEGSGTSRVGLRPPLHRLQLLLVLPRPRRQLR